MEAAVSFWDKNAKRYDRFMGRDRAAYEALYEKIRPVVRHRTVLEVAAGTGLISRNIVDAARWIEATDASEEMICQARRENFSAKLRFSVQDLFHLPYGDETFDVVIAANVLHVIPRPEAALRELSRVLRPNGVLIAPTFTHAENSVYGKLRAFVLKLAGFPLYSKWSGPEYLAFLHRCGWTVRTSAELPASFPLTYAECVKAAGQDGKRKPEVRT